MRCKDRRHERIRGLSKLGVGRGRLKRNAAPCRGGRGPYPTAAQPGACPLTQQQDAVLGVAEAQREYVLDHLALDQLKGQKEGAGRVRRCRVVRSRLARPCFRLPNLAKRLASRPLVGSYLMRGF
mgnify:CR=1 FL=1